jgi:alanine racemase
VAQAGEALTLREAGVRVPVLAWLFAPGADLAPLVLADVDLSVSAPWALHQVRDAALRCGRRARVHLKVDTGLARNGVAAADWPDLVDAVRDLAAEGVVHPVGVFSHYAWADAPDHPTVHAQTAAFDAAIALAQERGVVFELRHLANSAATVTHPRARYDLVRPGIAVYGLSPVPGIATSAQLGLRPAMTLLGRLALVKQVPAGSGVSYGHAYTTPVDTTVALLPLGYADGLPRHAGNAGPVQLRGERFTVAGRVCMDQVVLDLGDPANRLGAVAGDTAVVFGDGSDGAPTAEDWAVAAGTIGYEIVTRIGARVPRRYLGGS